MVIGIFIFSLEMQGSKLVWNSLEIVKHAKQKKLQNK
jgi:hypothetical protein